MRFPDCPSRYHLQKLQRANCALCSTSEPSLNLAALAIPLQVEHR